MRDVVFFNFSCSKEEFKIPLYGVKQYLAFDETMTEVLARSDSFNSIAKKVGLSNVSVRTNMDWHLGTDIVIKGVPVHGYLREAGNSLRTEHVFSQLSPKNKHPFVELTGRTLYDLIPGKLHAISVESLDDYGVYDNERHLWTSLNPSFNDKLAAMSTQESKNYLNNRVGRYINIARPTGNPTELGHFYFCRHPDYLAGLTKVAEGLFAINLVTRVCKYYSNIKQAEPHNRTTVRNHLNRGTLYRKSIRYIYARDLIKQLPEIKDKEVITLTKEQLTIALQCPLRK